VKNPFIYAGIIEGYYNVLFTFAKGERLGSCRSGVLCIVENYYENVCSTWLEV
jgi:hypothetical protein